jgi:hypothetical protein
LTVAVTLLHVAIAIATIAIIVRGQRWPWNAAVAFGSIGSIGAAQHGDLVSQNLTPCSWADVSLPAVRAQEHVNKRRHPCRCLLHSFQ